MSTAADSHDHSGAEFGMPATGPGSTAFVGRRFVALLVDGLLSMGVAMLLTGSTAPGLWSAAVLVLEYVFFTGVFTQTPGMRFLGIACVRLQDRQSPIGIPAAVIRALLLQLVIPAAILDHNGRGWHDKAARSVVIRLH